MTETITLEGVPPKGPFKPSTTGAIAATRFVGGTTAGSPVTGTFQVGDFVTDQSGSIWVCVVAGTPGTWVDIAKTEIAAKQDATNVTHVNPTEGAQKAIPGLTDTSYLLARPYHVVVTGWVQHSAASAILSVGVYLDGVLQDQQFFRGNPTAAAPSGLTAFLRVPPPTPGTKTIDVRMGSNTAGTTTWGGTASASRMTITRG